LRRRTASPPRGVSCVDEVCGEAQLNDEKDCQNGVNDGDDTHSHDEYDTDVVWQKLLGEDSRSTGLKM